MNINLNQARGRKKYLVLQTLNPAACVRVDLFQAVLLLGLQLVGVPCIIKFQTLCVEN